MFILKLYLTLEHFKLDQCHAMESYSFYDFPGRTQIKNGGGGSNEKEIMN